MAPSASFPPLNLHYKTIGACERALKKYVIKLALKVAAASVQIGRRGVGGAVSLRRRSIIPSDVAAISRTRLINLDRREVQRRRYKSAVPPSLGSLLKRIDDDLAPWKDGVTQQMIERTHHEALENTLRLQVQPARI